MLDSARGVVRARKLALVWGMLSGLVMGVCLCGWVAADVEFRGCNPVLDHSDVGVPLCR